MAEHAAQGHHHETPSDAARHEPTDVNAGGVLFSIALLTLAVVIVCVAAWDTLEAMWMKPAAGSLSAAFGGDVRVHLLPEPRLEGIDELETSQSVDNGLAQWRTHYEAEQKALEGYGWSNQEKGLVHIPICSAMEITIEKKMFPVETSVERTERKSQAVNTGGDR